MSLDSHRRLVIDDLKGKSLSLYSSRRLTRAQYEAFGRPRFVSAIARRLLQSGSYLSLDGELVLQLVYLKELDGSEFPFVMFLLKNDIDTIAPQALRAFVGHRFLPHITGPLRYNLASLFEPYKIELSVADEDLMSGPVLDIIINKLEQSHFAIFDNRETGTKPNVYIELGIAYHMRKPFILFDYRDPVRPTEDVIPSDLAGFLAVRYHSYKHLFDEFSLKLPTFVYKNLPGIAKR